MGWVHEGFQLSNSTDASSRIDVFFRLDLQVKSLSRKILSRRSSRSPIWSQVEKGLFRQTDPIVYKLAEGKQQMSTPPTLPSPCRE